MAQQQFEEDFRVAASKHTLHRERSSIGSFRLECAQQVDTKHWSLPFHTLASLLSHRASRARYVLMLPNESVSMKSRRYPFYLAYTILEPLSPVNRCRDRGCMKCL